MQDLNINPTKFKIAIEGMQLESCSSITGLILETEKFVIDHGDQRNAQYRKGKTYAADIEITRRFVDTKMFQWFKECRDGKITQRSGSIILMDDKGEEVIRFNLEGTWPIRWTGPALHAGGASIHAVETLSLVIESLDIG